MNFVDQKAEDASYNSSFRRNLIEICEKCILHFPEKKKKKNDFRAFLEEAYQIDFLKSDDILEENKRGILKTFYVNKEKIFLVLYQLHMKICSEFFYLDPKTLKFAVLYELNKVQTLLSDLEKLAVLNARVTVFYKSFFLERMAQILGSYFLQSESKRLYQTLLLNLNKCGSYNKRFLL